MLHTQAGSRFSAASSPEATSNPPPLTTRISRSSLASAASTRLRGEAGALATLSGQEQAACFPFQARPRAAPASALRPFPASLPKVNVQSSVGTLITQADPLPLCLALQGWLQSESCPDSLLALPPPTCQRSQPLCPQGHSCLRHIRFIQPGWPGNSVKSAAWAPRPGHPQPGWREGARVEERPKGLVRTEQRVTERNAFTL